MIRYNGQNCNRKKEALDIWYLKISRTVRTISLYKVYNGEIIAVRIFDFYEKGLLGSRDLCIKNGTRHNIDIIKSTIFAQLL